MGTQNSGFTLLEVLLSIAILAFISVLTANSIQSSIRFKSKTIAKIEENSKLQDALKIMSEDIKYAFNYRDINIEVFNLAQEERKKRATAKANDKSKKTSGETPPPTDDPDADGTTPTPSAPENEASQKNYEKKKETRLTHFIGQRDRLDFSSLSFSRTTENSPYSNQAEVGYFLEDCKGRLDKTKQSQCLWRRISPVIDDKIDEGGTKQVLLDNVNSLKLRYIGPENEQEWRQDWMSDDRGDAVTKNKFPYAVEITLEIQEKTEKSKPLAMTVVAQLSFPNNQKTTEEKAEESVEDKTGGKINEPVVPEED